MSSSSHWHNSVFHTLHAPRPPWRIHNPRAQPRPPRASFFPGSPSPSSRVTWLGDEVSYGVKANKPGYSITPPDPTVKMCPHDPPYEPHIGSLLLIREAIWAVKQTCHSLFAAIWLLVNHTLSQSPCTVLLARNCLPLGLCKGTVTGLLKW